MGTVVHLLLGEPVARALWVVCVWSVPVAGDPQGLHGDIVLATRRLQ